MGIEVVREQEGEAQIAPHGAGCDGAQASAGPALEVLLISTGEHPVRAMPG